MLINKTTLQQFKTDLKAAVAELEDKYGVVITPNNSTYSDIEFSLTIKVANRDAENVKLQRIFARYPWFRNWYNRRFKDGKHYFTITGYEPSKKYSIVCERDDGEPYGFTPSHVKELLQDLFT